MKTLNDLKEDTCKIASVDNPTIYGFSEIIKAEAIKRWKYNHNLILDSKDDIEVLRADAKCCELMEFNNLTEEDLQ